MLLLNALIGTLIAGMTTAAPFPTVAVTNASLAVVRPPLVEPSVPSRDWKSIVLHHSATTGGNVASIDRVHRQQKDSAGKLWLGIGYHFVVGNGQSMGDGEIQPTFRWLEQLPGAHAGQQPLNQSGIGICLIGNFDEVAPTAKQVAAVRGLMGALAERYAIPRERMLRHLDVQATLCPGRLFPWDQLLADLSREPKGS